MATKRKSYIEQLTASKANYGNATVQLKKDFQWNPDSPAELFRDWLCTLLFGLGVPGLSRLHSFPALLSSPVFSSPSLAFPSAH